MQKSACHHGKKHVKFDLLAFDSTILGPPQGPIIVGAHIQVGAMLRNARSCAPIRQNYVVVLAHPFVREAHER